MHAPSTTHWTVAKRVLRYLKNTIDHGLLYRPGSLHLQAFSDSDWASSPDDRRSTSGFGVYLGNYLVSWSAKKQAVVSRSSTEAEYRSLALTTAELFWLRMLFKELSIPLRTAPMLWCDNLSALALASNSVFHARTKHIEVDYHFIHEKVLNGDILIRFISTHNQVADIFTKGMSSAQFSFLKSKLMVTAPPISLHGDVSVQAVSTSATSSAKTCPPASAPTASISTSAVEDHPIISEDSSPISAADSNLIGAFALTHKHPDYTETTEPNTESFPTIKDPNSAMNEYY
jgi:hypothetical protein